MQDAISAHFLTLTYTDEHVPISENGEQQLNKTHMQLFIKRLRKHEQKLLRKSITRPDLSPRKANPIRYYTVGEYGTKTQRPHYHSIIFNLSASTVDRIEQLWGQGNVHVGKVTTPSIHYVTKYVINRYQDYTGKQPPFANISQGIGRNYLRNARWHQNNLLRTYVVSEENKMLMPRYYRDKLFDKGQLRYLSDKNKNHLIQHEREHIEQMKHHDPLAYLDEQLVENHKLKELRINEKNKF